MKFRGRMTDSQCMREFSNTVNTLSKLGKHGVICLTSTTVSFIIFDDGAPKRILAECTLEQKNFFNEYDVFGVSKEFNQICLEFSPDLLAKATSALKSPQSSKSIKLKLTKKNLPCLTCEIEMPTHLKHSRVCIHDIPVEIISRKSWPEFQLPPLPPFDLGIRMPSLKRFKTICERMKFLSSQLILEATPGGILTLKTETDLAAVTTFFTNLKVEKTQAKVINQVPRWLLASTDVDLLGFCLEVTGVKHLSKLLSNPPLQVGGFLYTKKCDVNDTFSVKVDFKKIIGFLSIEQVNPNNVICNIVDKKLIFMDVIHDNVELHYLIPGLLK